jgi:hypothetical protein
MAKKKELPPEIPEKKKEIVVETPKIPGLLKVKATTAEVMVYQEQGILYGWDPHNGIATIKQ